MYIDTHSHLNDLKYNDDLNAVIDNLKLNKIDYIINIGFDLQSSKRAVELSNTYENMYSAIGIHPDTAGKISPNDFHELDLLANNKKVVAIGETGFDFYWKTSTFEEQESSFLKHIELANKHNLPLVLHSRDSSKQMLDFLTAHYKNIKNGFVLHCFSESLEMALEYAKLGAYFSFGGVITFKNAKKEDIIRAIPLDKLLTETDCPYLTPEPHRGTRNEPSYVKYVHHKMADVLNISVDNLSKIVAENAKRLFKIELGAI